VHDQARFQNLTEQSHIMDSRKQLAFAICEFLQDSMKTVSDDSKEGLEGNDRSYSGHTID
jgi:hypothetical protein